MKTQRILFLAPFLAVLCSAPANAEVIVDWDLASMAGNETTREANSAAVGVIGNALTEGATLIPNLGAGSMNARDWDGEANDYFSFGFTVADGYRVDLDSLVIGSKSSSSGPGSMGLYYSGDHFASVLYTFSETGSVSNDIVNLGALDNLTGTVEFRLVQIGTLAANGGTSLSTGTFRITEYSNGTTTTNLQLNGTVTAVPEADISAMLLAGLGLLGLMARRPRT